MTEENQASLHDLFQLFDKAHHVKQASYMLLFLWKDIAPPLISWDPIFPVKKLNSKFICSRVLENNQAFPRKLHIFSSRVDTFMNADSWVTDKFTCL